MATEADQINYTKQILVDLIAKNLPNETLVKYDLKCLTQVNGFMSTVYNLSLDTKVNSSNKKKHRKMIIKFLKGDAEFRHYSEVLFINEIYFYNTVIPYYEKLLQGAPKSSIKVSRWVPKLYIALFGCIDGLKSSSPESVLALENLTQHGFRNGPRVHLDREHMLLMVKSLAEYHSLTYVLKIREDPKLQTLIDGITPILSTLKDGSNTYDAMFSPGFNRFFEYFDKIKDTITDNAYVANVNKFKREYGARPSKLIDRLRQADGIFSVILHGDYNRNNVLFRYEKEDGFDNPQEIRMIDFQELRYGSPATDLAFCMYMNIDPSIRNDVWFELLKIYHTTVIKSIANILEVDVEHEDLEQYSFEKFYGHFSKFAFYGAMICIHFLPWMVCSEKECAETSLLCDEDFHGDAFKNKVSEIGGDHANQLVFDIVRHANREGYFEKIFAV